MKVNKILPEEDDTDHHQQQQSTPQHNNGSTTARAVLQNKSSSNSSIVFGGVSSVATLPASRATKKQDSAQSFCIQVRESGQYDFKVNSSSNTHHLHHHDEEDHASTASNMMELGGGLCFRSISFCLVGIISSLVILSVVILTSIWISTTVPTLSVMSSQLRVEQFSTVVNSINQMIQNLVIVSETTKRILTEDFDYTNPALIEKTMYNLYKSEVALGRSEITVTLYIGDTVGNCWGIYRSGDSLFYLDVDKQLGQKMYMCEDVSSSNYCKRNPVNATIELPPFDLGPLVSHSNMHSGRPSFSASYVDPTIPTVTFLTLLNTFNSTIVKNFNFNYYFGYDVTSSSISSLLERQTKSADGSVAFVIETKTEFLIACSDKGHPLVEVNESNGELTRKTGLTFADELTSQISKILYHSVNNNLSTLSCGKVLLAEGSMYYMNAMRMCSEQDLDWIVVWATPQNRYTQSTTVALSVSGVSSIVIICIALIVGVLASKSIVKPFHKFMQAAESISNMELESFSFSDTRIVEVEKLQKMFVTLANRLKTYRSFLPSNVLLEIDNGGKIVNANLSHHKESHMGSFSLARGSSSSFHFKKNKLALRLEKRQVTTCGIYLEGFDYCIQHLDYHDIILLLSDLFDSINKTSQTSAADVGQFDNELVTLAWNSLADQPNHIFRGISNCHILRDKLLKSLEKWNARDDVDNALNVRMSLHTQDSIVGNIGTRDSKTHASIGSIHSNMKKLSKTCSTFSISLLVTELIYKESADTFLCRYIDTIRLFRENDCSINMSEEKTEPVAVYEIGNRNDVKMDEWMYELKEKGEKTKWDRYIQGCQHYQNGEYKEALELFEDFETIFEERYGHSDLPSLNLIAKCKMHL